MPRTLQDAVTRAFKGRGGSAAVLRISDGSLIARHRPDLMKTVESPPGSAIKPFTLKALLRGGVASMVCRRQLTVSGQRLDCSHPPASEPLNAAGALALSCNCWFAAMAARTTPEVLWREFQAHSLSAGIATTRGALVLQALGIDGIKCTPLALARAYRRLALDRTKAGNRFAPVYEGLEESVRRGTSIAAGIHAGSPVSGKTGTTKAGAWFAGFNDGIALAVFLFQGTGGADAAPIAGEVFAAWRDGLR
jgi:cell division protein FtsI/penicillin-binding protein 2